jgi:hypothetical protein
VLPGLRARRAVEELMGRCAAAHAAGTPFPTVWQTFLSSDPLVIGLPRQERENEHPVLKVRLITRQHLVFGPGGYSLA